MSLIDVIHITFVHASVNFRNQCHKNEIQDGDFVYVSMNENLFTGTHFSSCHRFLRNTGILFHLFNLSFEDIFTISSTRELLVKNLSWILMTDGFISGSNLSGVQLVL